MGFLNLISLVGIFGLCAIAWLFSENRDPKYFPWRIVLVGLAVQFGVGALVFLVPLAWGILQSLSGLLGIVFEAADAGARFIFGRLFVPFSGQDSFFLVPLVPGAESCATDSIGQVVPGFCGIRVGYIFAFRALPAVVFLSGLIALFYRIGLFQLITNLVTRVSYPLIRLSGAEILGGAANILVGIESAIVVRPYLRKMTRSELCAILACCFGTASSAALASYVSILRPIFPNVLPHLVAATMMGVPACFLLSKILIPETETPFTAWPVSPDRAIKSGISERAFTDERELEIAPERLSPTEAAISGAVEGVKIAISIVGALILILGIVYLLYGFLNWLTTLPAPLGNWFRVISLPNLLGILSLPFTVMTGISLNWSELWQSSVLIGRRLLETAILPYQSIVSGVSGVGDRWVGDRALLILTYTLSGFAHFAYWGIVVGAAIALVPSRRHEVIGLCWKAFLAGILATYMVGCIAGFYEGIFGADTIAVLGKS
ncbi:nucleoside transporter C-terminal domain-containing protein [Egbenema bharatensis]|uniref:nucleoside transporter C-terminal domain-containing protein n=1 Tax=Egbenema bharatensis TaxID=3463334 RepID=UPI003A8C879B